MYMKNYNNLGFLEGLASDEERACVSNLLHEVESTMEKWGCNVNAKAIALPLARRIYSESNDKSITAGEILSVIETYANMICPEKSVLSNYDTQMKIVDKVIAHFKN